LHKQILAFAVSALLFMHATQGQAKEISDSASVKISPIKKARSVKRIDTLSLSQKEKDLGSLHIKELLHDQLSPLRKQMRENHNVYVNSYINKYTNPHFRSHLSKMKGLASYYFPIFEKVFNETNVPTEIKY